MQVVILAGGYGTRLSEETERIPKPMVEIAGKPILIHIMEHFASFGHTDFVLALGYKSILVKQYFSGLLGANYDFDINLKKREITPLSGNRYDWTVKLVDTGLDSMTGGRVKRLERYLEPNFFLTYGDGLSDVNLDEVEALYRENSFKAVVTAVNPPPRFGSLEIDDFTVREFREKSSSDTGWINGGFFVMSREICDLIDGDEVVLEKQPLSTWASKGMLGAYKHYGFWHAMDTLRDKRVLEELASQSRVPWKMNS